MTRLVCLPPAGSGTADFRRWADLLPASLSLHPVALPGREGLLSHPPFTAMDDAVAWVADRVAALRGDLALYGHSFGAWVAWEVAWALHARGRAPVHLFVGARRAPDQPGRYPPIAHLPDGPFADAVHARYGAIPDRLRARPAILALFLPALRADYAMMEGYAFRDRGPLPLPITAFRGLSDATVDRAEVAAWGRLTTGPFALRQLPGGHFFHRDHPELLCDALAGALRR